MCQKPHAGICPELVRELLTAVESHKRTKAESLQLLNLRVPLTVEESEGRRAEEQVEALLQTVTSLLPAGPEADRKTAVMRLDGEDPA
nr:DNA-directed RNA polymerase III subunit RPC9-like [Camelus dromedarius]